MRVRRSAKTGRPVIAANHVAAALFRIHPRNGRASPGRVPRPRPQARNTQPDFEFFVPNEVVLIMKSKLVGKTSEQRTFVIVLDPGEEAFASLTAFAVEQGITAASLTAIGAFEKAVVGWFDFQSKSYRKIPVQEQCEVLSAIGDVALDDSGKSSLHVHAVLGLSDGSTRGGHLLEGFVQPTLEVTMLESPGHLRRRRRSELGIALIDLEAS
jgi:predicted DNA-binding protein with PD1-like motif